MTQPKTPLIALSLFILSALVVGCSSAPSAATPDESEVATSVAATLAALNAQDATPTPPPTDPPSTATAAPTLAATAAATEAGSPGCRVATNALNLRSGPGTVYAPPLEILQSGTALGPRARNADASWIEVEVAGSRRVGWVSGAPQFVTCDLDLRTLPLGVIPPTPPLLVVGAIEGTVDEVVSDRVRLEISANDPGVGTRNGAGIEFVRFSILFGGVVVYESVDSSPPYCAIPGDDNCFYDFPDPEAWPNGGAIQNGPYIVRANVHALNGRVDTVEAKFEVDIP